jgi:O-antigen/teichoic acid export membrane protein
LSFKKNTFANYLGQGWTALMGLAFIPVYIDRLGIEAWGLVGFMVMMQAWLTLLDMGLTPALSREMTRFTAGVRSPEGIRDLLRSLEYCYGGVALAILILVWASSTWIATNWLSSSALQPDMVANAIATMGFVLASRMAEQVYRGAIQGLQKQVWLNGVQSIFATLRWGGAVIVVMFLEPSINAFFLWQGGVSIITLITFARKTYLLLPSLGRAACFDLSVLESIRNFAGGMMLTTFLALLLTQVDKILLSRFLSLAEFGQYTLAASTAGALAVLVSPIATAAMPRLTELVTNGESENLTETYHRASQWTALALFPPSLMLAFFSESIMLVWTADPVLSHEVAPLLSLLAIGSMFNGLMLIPYMMQLAHGWTGLAVRMNLIAVLFLVPGIVWAVPRFGSIGAAWVWLLLNMGYIFIGVGFMHSRILPKEKWSWYRNAIAKPLVAGLLLGGMLYFFGINTESRPYTLMYLVVFSIIMFGGVACSIPMVRLIIFQFFGSNARS